VSFFIDNLSFLSQNNNLKTPPLIYYKICIRVNNALTLLILSVIGYDINNEKLYVGKMYDKTMTRPDRIITRPDRIITRPVKIITHPVKIITHPVKIITRLGKITINRSNVSMKNISNVCFAIND
jgi:hypothetical protein